MLLIGLETFLSGMETQEYAEGNGLYTILETFLSGMETKKEYILYIKPVH